MREFCANSARNRAIIMAFEARRQVHLENRQQQKKRLKFGTLDPFSLGIRKIP
jgi:hypothetical protein